MLWSALTSCMNGSHAMCSFSQAFRSVAAEPWPDPASRGEIEEEIEEEGRWEEGRAASGGGVRAASQGAGAAWGVHRTASLQGFKA